MKYCPQCGAEVKEDDTYCNQCGHELHVQEQPPAPKVRLVPKPEITVSWASVIIMAVILVAASVGGIYIMTNDMDVQDKDITVSYTWSADGRNYSHSITIPYEDYRSMERTKIDRSGTSSSDMYIRTVDGESDTVYGVKDYIVVDDNIKAFTADLKALYDDRYSHSIIKPEFAQFLAWFVQNAIDYADDKQSGSDEYWKYPLETLRDGKGDCEDGSILLAALLDAAGYEAGVFLIPGHAMAGVSSDSVSRPYLNERFGYYPIETATPAHTELHEIGYVSSDYANVYFHLYTGHSEKYA